MMFRAEFVVDFSKLLHVLFVLVQFLSCFRMHRVDDEVIVNVISVAVRCNEYAVAIAKAVAENPAVTYNPVFLWGGVGLGKTHLMHAIGNSIQRNFPEKKIVYVTCDQFVNEFIESIHNNTNPTATKSFRDK